MTASYAKAIIVVIASALCVTSCGSSQSALQLTDPWVRFSGANAAAYVGLTNTSAQDETLVDVDVATSVALSSELRSTSGSDGSLTGSQRVDSVVIPGMTTVRLEPGGYFVMISGVQAKANAGTRIPITFTFEKSGKHTVEAQVRS